MLQETKTISNVKPVSQVVKKEKRFVLSRSLYCNITKEKDTKRRYAFNRLSNEQIKVFCLKNHNIIFEPFYISTSLVSNLRKGLKLTQKQFSKLLNCSQKRISNLERMQSAIDSNYTEIKEKILAILERQPETFEYLKTKYHNIYDLGKQMSSIEEHYQEITKRPTNTSFVENIQKVCEQTSKRINTESMTVINEILNEYLLQQTNAVKRTLWSNIEKTTPQVNKDLYTIPINLKSGVTSNVIESIKAILILSDSEFDILTKDSSTPHNPYRNKRLIFRLAEAINNKDELTIIRKMLLSENGYIRIKTKLINDFEDDF